MKLTPDQLKHVEEAHRLALQAEVESRKAKPPVSEGPIMRIGSALSLAKDPLGNILEEAPQDNR